MCYVNTQKKKSIKIESTLVCLKALLTFYNPELTLSSLLFLSLFVVVYSNRKADLAINVPNMFDLIPDPQRYYRQLFSPIVRNRWKGILLFEEYLVFPRFLVRAKTPWCLWSFSLKRFASPTFFFSSFSDKKDLKENTHLRRQFGYKSKPMTHWFSLDIETIFRSGMMT